MSQKPGRTIIVTENGQPKQILTDQKRREIANEGNKDKLNVIILELTVYTKILTKEISYEQNGLTQNPQKIQAKQSDLAELQNLITLAKNRFKQL